MSSSSQEKTKTPFTLLAYTLFQHSTLLIALHIDLMLVEKIIMTGVIMTHEKKWKTLENEDEKSSS